MADPEEKVTLEEFTRHLDMLKNIRQGQDAQRFKFTKLELNALEFCAEFMEKSLV